MDTTCGKASQQQPTARAECPNCRERDDRWVQGTPPNAVHGSWLRHPFSRDRHHGRITAYLQSNRVCRGRVVSWAAAVTHLRHGDSLCASGHAHSLGEPWQVVEESRGLLGRHRLDKGVVEG